MALLIRSQTEGWWVLVLENEQGHPRLVTGGFLGTVLHNKRSLRLVVLNSCEGARGSRSDPLRRHGAEFGSARNSGSDCNAIRDQRPGRDNFLARVLHRTS